MNESNEPIFCLDALKAIVGDDAKVIHDLLYRYVGTATSGLDAIAVALRTRDLDALERLSHKLKSSSRAVGALAMAKDFENLEDAAARHDWLMIEQVDLRLRALWSTAAPSLQQELEAYP